MRIVTVVTIITIALFASSVAAQRGNGAEPRDSTAVQLPPGNIAHGRYLAEHVANCVECHSGRDGAGNIIEGEQYLGGNIPFAPPWANDWAMRAPRNRGLVGYDDKAALRLLTEGAIGRDVRQLRPPMPRFRMNRSDAEAVVAYLKSLN